MVDRSHTPHTQIPWLLASYISVGHLSPLVNQTLIYYSYEIKSQLHSVFLFPYCPFSIAVSHPVPHTTLVVLSLLGVLWAVIVSQTFLVLGSVEENGSGTLEIAPLLEFT